MALVKRPLRIRTDKPDLRPESPNVASPATQTPPRTRLAPQAAPWWTIVALILLVLIFTLLKPRFFSREAWLATSQYVTEFLLLGLGETFIIITAGIDLSVGAILGTSAMVGALAMEPLYSGGVSSTLVILVGLIATLASGLAMGCLNGILITRFRLSPFIATLATLTALGSGVIFLISNGGLSISNLPNQLGSIGNTDIWGWIPIPVLITALLALILGGILQRTRFGMYTYAIGSSRAAAERAGLDINRHLMKVYILCGLLSSIAGFLVMATFVNASPIAGQNDELYAIASVAIGGASLFGGRGTISGTVIGAFIIGVLTTGLVIVGLQPFWQEVAIGAVIALAVAVDRARNDPTET